MASRTDDGGITAGEREELRDLANRDDKLGKIARAWLDLEGEDPDGPPDN